MFLRVSAADNSLNWWSITRQNCINVFMGLTFFMIVVTIIKYAAFVSVCMQASINLHNKMFSAITRATMYFFNTNSSGKYKYLK